MAVLAILAALASSLGPATKLGKLIGDTIKRQFNYLCCIRSNFQALKDEEGELRSAREGLQLRVDAAANNGLVILPRVRDWLEKEREMQVNTCRIGSEISNMKCIAFSYSLSKKTAMITDATKKLREECPKPDEIISHPPPPPAMLSDFTGIINIQELDSRKKIEDEIVALLMDEEVQMIGIFGMGGVGKTTLAKKIRSRVLLEEGTPFGESLMVVISQHPDMLKIQDEIAENLGLDLKDIMSETLRAKKIRSRVMNGKKRILVVFDDVWKDPKLEELGIPFNGRCTILLTSRDMGVLAKMNAKPICEVQTLNEEETLSLFKKELGIGVDDPEWIYSKAQEVVKECKGLPLALAVVAGALKANKHHKPSWNDTLGQLRSANPEDMPDVVEDVYTPLKLSYDYLRSENAKFIFLLCCLFAEDSDIPLETLTAYAVGLGKFEGIKDLAQVRNRTHSLVEMLKSHSLLLESRKQQCVRMHDVVRDVAIYIAASKENRLIKCRHDCEWISTFHGRTNVDLYSGSTFLNLRLLMVGKWEGREMEMRHNSFDGMAKLNVLSFMDHSLMTSLSHSTRLLKNLRTLILGSCRSLTTLDVVGELVNLEILICRHCYSIQELSPEIKGLKCLKLLEISCCLSLKKIRRGVISNLHKLEELKIINSFYEWEAEGRVTRNKNVRLNELESLPNLIRLEIEILEDDNLTRRASSSCSAPKKIQKYHIIIGEHITGQSRVKYDSEIVKIMSSNLPSEISLEKWIQERVMRNGCSERPRPMNATSAPASERARVGFRV